VNCRSREGVNFLAQSPINAVTGKVKPSRNQLSGNAINQEL